MDSSVGTEFDIQALYAEVPYNNTNYTGGNADSLRETYWTNTCK